MVLSSSLNVSFRRRYRFSHQYLNPFKSMSLHELRRNRVSQCTLVSSPVSHIHTHTHTHAHTHTHTHTHGAPGEDTILSRFLSLSLSPLLSLSLSLLLSLSLSPLLSLSLSLSLSHLARPVRKQYTVEAAEASFSHAERFASSSNRCTRLAVSRACPHRQERLLVRGEREFVTSVAPRSWCGEGESVDARRAIVWVYGFRV